MRLKRVFYPYWEWEDYIAGMWREADEKRWLQQAIEFTGDAELYGSWMLRVIESWPKACEHNLTCEAMNRLAWIGHAACCLATGIPEQITRKAWAYLSDQQRDRANAKAQEALDTWLERYRHRNQLPLAF